MFFLVHKQTDYVIYGGITIKSTDEIRNIIDNMLDEEYETLKANACKIGGKLRRGYFLKSAMKQSI